MWIKSVCFYPNLTSGSFWCLQTAAAQAAVWRGATAADDLQLFLGAVGAVQKLLNELLQTHLSICFTCRRLLEEVVDLGNLPADTERGEEAQIMRLFFKLVWNLDLNVLRISYRLTKPPNIKMIHMFCHYWCSICKDEKFNLKRTAGKTKTHTFWPIIFYLCLFENKFLVLIKKLDIICKNR